MKRPLAVVGFTFLAALAAASCGNLAVNASVAAFLVVCAVLTAAFHLTGHWKMAAVVLLTIVAALGEWCLVDYFQYEPAAALDSRQVTIVGKISDLPDKSYGKYYYVIKTDQILSGGKTVPIKTQIRLTMTEPLDGQPLDTVRFSAKVSVPQNYGGTGFDSRAYYRSKGIYLFATPLSTPSITASTKKSPYYYAIQLRTYISSAIDRYVTGDWGALCSGILIGDTAKIPQQTVDDFRTTGISHILAVSGTQISLIMQYLLLAFAALRLPKRLRAALAMAGIVIFMAVTGFSPSVMRAGIMGILFLTAMMFGRDADALNSLGFSVLALCAVNPFAATDIGLLLSFSATLGMILLSGRVEKWTGTLLGRFPGRSKSIVKLGVEAFGQTVAASLFTYPVIMVTFHQVSTVALLSNIFEVPASLFATLASAVLILVSPFSFLAFLIKPIALLLRLTAAFMMWFANLLASIPFATISTNYGFVWIFLGFAALACLLAFFFRGRGAKLSVIAVCAGFLLSVGLFSFSIAFRGVMKIASLPVSGGSCAVIILDSRAVVVDLAGYLPEYQVEQYLKAKNVSAITALVLPSCDQKRIKSVNNLIGSVKVEAVFLPGSCRTNQVASLHCVNSRTRVEIGGIAVDLIPNRDKSHLIAMVSYGGSSAVVTGTDETRLEDYPLGGRNLRAGVLMFGGELSSDFIRAVDPQVAEGGETTGSLYACAALESKGCETYRPENSALEVLTRGNGKYLVRRAGWLS